MSQEAQELDLLEMQEDTIQGWQAYLAPTISVAVLCILGAVLLRTMWTVHTLPGCTILHWQRSNGTRGISPVIMNSVAVAKQEFKEGLTLRAPSTIYVSPDKATKQFSALCGVRDDSRFSGRLRCIVQTEAGVVIHSTEPVASGEVARSLKVDVTGIDPIVLRAEVVGGSPAVVWAKLGFEP
jgi:hypothetical protein